MKRMFLGLVGLLLAVFMVGCNKTQSLKDVEQMASPNGEVKLMFALTEHTGGHDSKRQNSMVSCGVHNI